MKFIKKIFKRFKNKRYVKCTFREIEPLDSLISNPKKNDKFVFIIELEKPEHIELIAEGYHNGISCNVSDGWRYYITTKFFKFYKKIVTLEEAKKDFFTALKTRKKHFESY